MHYNSQEQMNIVVVGHVDHGKSTIIGRLLADTDSLPEGKLESIRQLCVRTSKPFEYAFLLDALKDERDQGITIDAARIFFQTQQRNYLIIDAPGHIEFLKNMITGASRAEAALLVIDAAEGVQENSRRHGYMLSMLGIDQVVVLVNKMDLVDYDETVFRNIETEYRQFLARLGVEPQVFVPVSGMAGDQIASASDQLSWYQGPTVLQSLDAFAASRPQQDQQLRLPVQDVYKFTRSGDQRRIVAGTLAAGDVCAGDSLVFYPSGKRSQVARIETFPEPENEENRPLRMEAPHPVGFTLEQQVYITRGELACRENETPPQVATRMRASIFWLGEQPLVPGKEYGLRIGTAKTTAQLERIEKLIDASTLEAREDAEAVGRHDVAEVILHSEQPVAFDPMGGCAETSRLVIVDNYEISGGGIVQEALADDQGWLRDKVLLRNIKWERSSLTRQERAERYSQQAALLLVTGSQDSHKKEVAKALESELFQKGRFVYYLGIGSLLYGVDADIKSQSPDSQADFRQEHWRRFAEVAHLFLDAGAILVATAVDLTAADMDLVHTVLQRYPVRLIWCGQEITTDVDPQLRLSQPQQLQQEVARIKGLLQEDGIVFSPA